MIDARNDQVSVALSLFLVPISHFLGLNTVTGKPRPGSILMGTLVHNDIQHLTKIAQDKPTWTQHLRQAIPGQCSIHPQHPELATMPPTTSGFGY